jgi:hypothetical protein
MSEVDIQFALFCDGPLNSKLARDKDDLYKDYVNQSNTYGHLSDFNQLHKWLESGLNPTTAMKHIVDVFKKNYNSFDEYFMIFNNFIDILFEYNPEIDKVLYNVMSFDDYDDVYPCYLTEYTYDFKVRGYMIDYIYKKNLTFGLLSVEEFIDVAKSYCDWSNVSDEYDEKELIDIENFLEMYYKILKSKSLFLRMIKV